MSGGDVLVLRALGIGDLITGLPALHLLRRSRPGDRIVLAAPMWLHPVVRLAGVVDAQVPGHELEPLVDAPWRPDLAIDLHGNGPESRALLAAREPDRLIAYADGVVRWDPDEHEIDRWCRLVREALPTDLSPPPISATLPVPNVPAPQGRTILHCGAKSPSRRWPPVRFAALARHLAAAGHDVMITGGPDETAIASEIAREAGVGAYTDLSLLHLVAVVAHARLVVSGDTGVAHVASAYATPSVVLFGPVSPGKWGPPPRPCHQLIWHGDGTGDPHGATIDPALNRIGVTEVLAGVARALDAPDERRVRGA